MPGRSGGGEDASADTYGEGKRFMVRRLTRLAMGASLVLTGLAWPGGIAAAAPAPGVFQVAASSDQPVVTEGQTFLTKDVYVDKTGDRIFVSGSADGTQPFYVDDIAEVTVTRPDGTVVRTSIDDSNGCTADTILTAPPRNIAPFLQRGQNKLHLVFKDACGGDFGNSDIFITGTAGFPTARSSLGYMDGGTFVAVLYDRTNPLSGEACTTAFSVQKDGVRYMLTAKHCFDGNLPGDDQTTNKNIARYAPLEVRSTDVHQTFAFATQLSCLAGESVCLLPPNRSKPGDMVAFTPDGAQPRNLVQTSKGLMKVFGELPWRKGQVLCHYGSGIGGESCGAVSVNKTADGLVTYNASSRCGDSGGPVYQYAYDNFGFAIGVFVAGMQVTGGAGKDGCRVGPAGQFIPVATIESTLGVRLVLA
jgi:hypothetical protein